MNIHKYTITRINNLQTHTHIPTHSLTLSQTLDWQMLPHFRKGDTYIKKQSCSSSTCCPVTNFFCFVFIDFPHSAVFHGAGYRNQWEKQTLFLPSTSSVQVFGISMALTEFSDSILCQFWQLGILSLAPLRPLEKNNQYHWTTSIYCKPTIIINSTEIGASSQPLH